jgi:glutathione S-transferase
MESLPVNGGQKKSDEKERDFKLLVMDVSYFSGKLESYFRYKELSFDRVEPTLRELAQIKEKFTGTMQVPLVFDSRAGTKEEERWLRDTTPIIEYLECDPKLQHLLSIYPPCPVQNFFSFLLEDFADEYMWRPAMYLRWGPDFDASQYGNRFCFEFARKLSPSAPIPRIIRPYILRLRQWLFSVFGEGIESPYQHAIALAQYVNVLDQLEKVLQVSPFLLGNRPTLVDFGFMGPFFRHFASDPTARKIMQQRAPAVFEWVGRMWNARQSRMPAKFRGE